MPHFGNLLLDLNMFRSLPNGFQQFFFFSRFHVLYDQRRGRVTKYYSSQSEMPRLSEMV